MEQSDGIEGHMDGYSLDIHALPALEGCVVPIGIFRIRDGHLMCAAVSLGLCDLFGCEDRTTLVERMCANPHWNVHPDDVARVSDMEAAFVGEGRPYNLVVRISSDNGHRLVHVRGAMVTAEDAERLAVLWYVDEGEALPGRTATDTGATDELTASAHAMLNNTPAIIFTKDVATGKYLACNQKLATYAGKRAPEDVVGLTDQELFGGETATHFANDEMQALSKDEPHHLFEVVPDASGNPHAFQTTKLKFIDGTGRLCLLGMSVDVTAAAKVRRENEQEKAAYERALSTSAIYESIVDALAESYFNLYYVDVEYGERDEEGLRKMERSGTDFFADVAHDAPESLYEEDLPAFMAAIERDTLVDEICRHGVYVHQYRLIIDGVPTYVRLKATRVAGDERHVIIGVSNVDAQVREQQAAERAAEEAKSYAWLSALNNNLLVLYFVNLADGHYTEYSASRRFEELGIAKQGTDFFGTIYKNSRKAVHPDDQELFFAQFTQEGVLATIERDGVFGIDYRLTLADTPTYVRLKAAKVVEDGDELLIVGLFDEGVQILQEKEYARNLSVAREMATVDSLTHVKNKHAYAEWEAKINAQIERHEQDPFAVVVCDINNLKDVNDLLGHKEGDACIKQACSKICTVFAHSPVFRIGGDEFVAILAGHDYHHRRELMDKISALPEDRSKIRIGETIAAGMAEYNRRKHTCLLNVFEEADHAMYTRKQAMKAMWSQEGDIQVEKDQGLELEDAINGRKLILIADDLKDNREILGDLLEEDYDILFAADGEETLEVLRDNADEVALVLLDLYMPKMTGREVIAEMQLDEELMSIPVIFLTVDEKAELDCLKIGAMDFIPKPYPDIEIVKARIAKCIELSENRDLIRHTEHDKLTGLLNKDYFLRYVSRLDHIYKDVALDAVVCDVTRFHAANKQYGRQFGDMVLKRIGDAMRRLAHKTGGIACRQGGDTFLLYCPHQDDHERLLSEFLDDVYAESNVADRINLRFGVFADARQEPDVEERIACAKAAADEVKEDPERICGFYDPS